MTTPSVTVDIDPENLFMRWYEAIMQGWPEEEKNFKVVKRGKPMRYRDYYPEKLKNLYYAIPEKDRLKYQKMYANLCSICKNAKQQRHENRKGNQCPTPNQKLYKGSSVLRSHKLSSL